MFEFLCANSVLSYQVKEKHAFKMFLFFSGSKTYIGFALRAWSLVSRKSSLRLVLGKGMWLLSFYNGRKVIAKIIVKGLKNVYTKN